MSRLLLAGACSLCACTPSLAPSESVSPLAWSVQPLDVGRDAALEQPLEVALHRAHPEQQLVSGQEALLEAVPVLEHERAQLQKLAPERAGRTVALREGDELAKQMGMADLP